MEQTVAEIQSGTDYRTSNIFGHIGGQSWSDVPQSSDVKRCTLADCTDMPVE